MPQQVFKLPRRLVHPRRLGSSKSHMPEEVLPPAPLEGWKQGFSREAAQSYYEDELGLQLPSKPEYDVAMPDDLSAIGSMELGTLHAQYVAYVQWLESALAVIEITAREDASYLEHVAADIRLRKSGTVPDKQAKTLKDQRYVDAEQTALISSAKAKLLKARVNGYERLAAALSREMTRRSIVE